MKNTILLNDRLAAHLREHDAPDGLIDSLNGAP